MNTVTIIKPVPIVGNDWNQFMSDTYGNAIAVGGSVDAGVYFCEWNLDVAPAPDEPTMMAAYTPWQMETYRQRSFDEINQAEIQYAKDGFDATFMAVLYTFPTTPAAMGLYDLAYKGIPPGNPTYNMLALNHATSKLDIVTISKAEFETLYGDLATDVLVANAAFDILRKQTADATDIGQLP